MQGSRDRRPLNGFTPFREDEIVETKFKDKDSGDNLWTYYPTFSGRLRVARLTFPDLKVRTRIVKGDLRVAAVVQAFCEGTTGTNTTRGCGTGTADKLGDGRLLDSLIELAETRAIGRALRSMGVGSDMAGAEEMDREGIRQEGLSRARDDRDNEHREKTRDRANEGRDPFEGTASGDSNGRVGTPRVDLGARIMKMAKDDKAKAKEILAWLVGRDSLQELTAFECKCAKMALDVVEKCGGDGKAAKRWVAETWQIPWFDKMTEAEYKQAEDHLKSGGVKDDTLKTHSPAGDPPF